MEKEQKEVKYLELDDKDADIIYVALSLLGRHMKEGITAGAYKEEEAYTSAITTSLAIKCLCMQLKNTFPSIKSISDRVEVVKAHIDSNGKVIRDATN